MNTDGERRRILQDREEDVSAKSASAFHLSSCRTRVSYHQRRFGEESAPLTATVESIKVAASQLQAKKYTSFGNLISVEKDRRSDARFSCNEFLAREVRRDTKSGARERGNQAERRSRR